MQSIPSLILTKAMRIIFCSPFVDRTKLSDSAGKATKDTKSRYRPSKGFTHSRHRCGNAYYEKLISKGCATQKVILLLHGGSYKVKLIDMYRRLAEKYSRLLSGATVISVDYRTFPQFEHPAQLEDTVEVYSHLLKSGIEPQNIIFIGDSAGATLALTSALWLRDNAYPLPAEIVCFSLCGDATSSGESKERNAYKDPIYGIPKSKSIEECRDYLHRISSYAKNLDRTSPYVSPCFGEFNGFPPVTLICGTADLDESDSDTVYKKMKTAGVDVKLYKFEGMFHDFQLIPFLPESKKAFSLIQKRTGV